MSRSRLASTLGLLLAATPVLAQNPELIEKEGARPAHQETLESEAAKAGAASFKLKATGGDVTYEDVTSDPDNIELNFAYAKTQVRHGELKGASATLERILLLNPNIAQIRLFYAVVLFRLDNLPEAEREINAVLASTPPDSIKTEATQYLIEIHKRQKHTQLSGRLGVGYEYDDNRNATPASGVKLFGGTPIILNSGSRRRDDTSVLFLGNAEAHHDLGLAAGHELFATFNYYRAEQTLVKTLNLSAYSPAIGGVYKTPFFDVTPQLVYDYVTLAQTKFLVNRGVDVRVDKKLSARADLYADVHDVRQIYSPTVVVPTASDRTGIQVDTTLGGDYLLCPTWRVGLSALYTVKHAQNNAYTFYRKGVGFSDTWLLGKGMFLLTSANLNVDNYPFADPVVSQGLRRDTTLQAGFTYGAPLSVLAPQLKDLLFTFTYEYYDATSTLTNYGYTNNKVSGLLTYKWTAGF